MSSLFLLIGTAGVGYFVGQTDARNESRRLVSGFAVQGLANNLMALRFIEREEIKEAQMLLQAETNGHLSWIMETDVPHILENDNGKCRVLNTLKRYRSKWQLFTTKEWDYLWSIQEMKEEEAKRQLFLDQLRCPNIFLYKID